VNISIAPVDSALHRVTIAGDLDLATASSLERCLSDELATAHDVELDVTELHFIDSTGIRAMVDALQRFSESGRAFRLLGPLPAQMRRVLEVTGLLERFPVVNATSVA